MPQPLYQQHAYPVFQNRMYDSADGARNCPRGDIVLAQDPVTGIVSNRAFQPELLVYDEHYQNEQGLSPSFQQHLDKVARIVEGALGRRRLVEVGCGKGYFLELLAQQGFDITGFDPAYEGSNPNIRREPFSPGIIDQAHGLVLRHVLEHIPEPIEFLRRIAAANGHSGRIYIEVPCFDWICQHRAWFDIFYEHVNYFRIADFHRWFGEVIESGHLFGGQYLYVVAELASLRSAAPPADTVRLPADFTASISALHQMPPGPRVVWGGASKGVIFALLMERAGLPVDTLVDINPAKQGRFVAGTGLRVSAPGEVILTLPPRAPIYVMNSNYLDEIRHMTQDRYTYIGVEHE
jgi:SAM-dependent methyltransferase